MAEDARHLAPAGSAPAEDGAAQAARMRKKLKGIRLAEGDAEAASRCSDEAGEQRQAASGSKNNQDDCDSGRPGESPDEHLLAQEHVRLQLSDLRRTLAKERTEMARWKAQAAKDQELSAETLRLIQAKVDLAENTIQGLRADLAEEREQRQKEANALEECIAVAEHERVVHDWEERLSGSNDRMLALDHKFRQLWHDMKKENSLLRADLEQARDALAQERKARAAEQQQHQARQSALSASERRAEALERELRRVHRAMRDAREQNELMRTIARIRSETDHSGKERLGFDGLIRKIDLVSDEVTDGAQSVAAFGPVGAEPRRRGTPSPSSEESRHARGKMGDKGKGKILVSGVTGYIGSHVARAFLDAGYQVRGTVRNVNKKVKHLQQWIDNGDALELVQADLLDEGSWGPACEGCDFLAHVASPFLLEVTEKQAEEKLYKPAVAGTMNVLRAAHKAGVRKVVLTSSIAAIENGPHPKELMSEPEKLWSSIDKGHPYMRSKTMAERAAWDFVKEQSEAGNEVFTLATINPSLVIGPPLGSANATSHEAVRRMLNREMPGFPNMFQSTVSVLDVAKAHVRALEVPEADGERFALAGQDTNFLDWCKTLRAEFKQYGYNVPTMRIPKFLIRIASLCDPSVKTILPKVDQPSYPVSHEKAERVLGIQFADEKETIIAHAHACLQLGVPGFKITKKYRKYMETLAPAQV
ncbi:Phenylacetaldehyde reductase (2-phenylethanol synthase) [Durusdinium trenchii]|uniref:Phenylacetaldehyde reductase (2-phenylethanol synthase) n=1 Tax=Durusdinium trenchii TaxID=1381693 RepID=A0ABP0IL54_9DINO